MGFWQQQIKQMMMANIDVLQVELFSPPVYPIRTHVSSALQPSAQGYNVPKVSPFIDPAICTSTSHGWPGYSPGVAIDLSTTAGKDAYVQVFTNFYNYYYNVNTDAYADSYIAQLSGRC